MKKWLYSVILFVSMLAPSHADLLRGSAVLVGYHPPYAREFIYIDTVKEDYRVLLTWLRDPRGSELYIQYYNLMDSTKSPVETLRLEARGLVDTTLNRSYDLYFGAATAVKIYTGQPTTVMITPREWISLRKGWAEVWLGR
jgi:hypothetical protein